MAEKSLNLKIKETGEVVNITSTKLIKIGDNMASLWGGCCYDYTIEKEKQEVTFMCKEHGEDFVTSLSYSEVYEEYKKL